MKKLHLALLAGASALAWAAPAHANFTITQGSGTTVVAFDATHSGTALCAGANTQCYAHVPIDPAGATLTGSAGNPSGSALTIQGIASGQAVPITGSISNSSFAVTQGTSSSLKAQVDPLTIATWGLAAASQNVAAPTNGLLGLCQFTTSPTTISTTNVSPLQCTNAASLLVNVTNANANGQAPMASSSPVVIASNQSNLPSNLVPATTGGLTNFVLEPAASDNHTVIKNGAGQVYGLHSFNNSATVNYGRLYNAGTGFNGCNSATNLAYEFHIPASTSDAGFVIAIPQGLAFATGISLCVSSAYGQTATTNATATAMSLNVLYN